MKIVVALGGNALGNTPEEQLEKAKYAAVSIADLILEGNDIVITHGNGPQVGMINLAFDEGSKAQYSPAMPFAECTAMSQGYIGYHLQQAIAAELGARGQHDIPVVSMITQVVVDEQDAAFLKPTKPVGGYYTEQEANALAEKTGYTYVEDAGRGYRRVVASPKPIDIYEKKSLICLMENKNVVIACGGGGVPIAKCGDRYFGVSAVVDKDFAAAKMAELIEADVLFILTAVDRVAIHFGKEQEEWLAEMTVSQGTQLAEEGHFAPGSMLPKVQAAMQFANSGKGRKAIIGSLDKAALALKGQSGTVVCG